MLKGLSNVKLLMILAGLVAIYFVIQFTSDRSRSDSFKATLVDIDTAKVTALQITKDGNDLKIDRSGDGSWEIGLDDGKTVVAKAASVKSALLNLQKIIPSRLASKDPSKWKDYQVDSTGTRVRVYHGDEQALDIILGRFGVKDQRSYHTFVRLFEDDQTYTVDNFMGVAFATDASSFREQMFFRVKKDSVHTIAFDYPDSAFTLTRNDQRWLVDGVPADSTSMADFMTKLNYTTSENFVDDVEDFGQPVLTITVKASGEEDLVLSGYEVSGRGLVLNSTLNPTAYFEDNALIEKFLIGKGTLLNSLNSSSD